VEFLAHALENGASPEQKDAARAGLWDLLTRHRSEVDPEGLNYRLAAQERIQEIIDSTFPERLPWPRLIALAIQAWPFLNRLLLVEKGITTPLSEFAILNAALSCTSLRRSQAGAGEGTNPAVAQPGAEIGDAESRMRTAVLLPSVGPVPVLLGILGT